MVIAHQWCIFIAVPYVKAMGIVQSLFSHFKDQFQKQERSRQDQVLPDVRVQPRAVETRAIYRTQSQLGAGAAWGRAETRSRAARPLPGKAGPRPGKRKGVGWGPWIIFQTRPHPHSRHLPGASGASGSLGLWWQRRPCPCVLCRTLWRCAVDVGQRGGPGRLDWSTGWETGRGKVRLDLEPGRICSGGDPIFLRYLIA